MKYAPQLAHTSMELVRGPGWIVERKWDGMRALFEISKERTLIFSRTGQDLCPQFPELCDLHKRLGIHGILDTEDSIILDGEIVAFREPGIEDLELLQMRLGDKQARRQADIPVEVRFFDVLEMLATDIRDRTLLDRRIVLSRLLDMSKGRFDMPELLPDGEAIPEHWEGTVSKKADSRYESGKRRRTWSKWKFVKRATLRVSGLTAGKGARSSSFGAAQVEDEGGTHRGQVGSGFTTDAIARMEREWDAWIENGGQRPLIEVEYRFLSKTGLLVNTAFKGFRDDKREADTL